MPVGVVPPVDQGMLGPDAVVDHRRARIVGREGGGDDVVVADLPDRIGLARQWTRIFAPPAADAGRMQEVEVGQLHQVVDAELVVGPEPVAAPDLAVAGIGQVAVVGDQGGIGEPGVAHPDPQGRMPLREWEGGHLGVRRDAVAVGAAHARARAVEAQAVVAALDRVADEAAAVEMGEAVRTAVVQGDGRAVLAAEHHHRRVQQPACEQPAPDLLGPGGDIPDVAHERGHLGLPADLCAA